MGTHETFETLNFFSNKFLQQRLSKGSADAQTLVISLKQIIFVKTQSALNRWRTYTWIFGDHRHHCYM